jgi:hypothetical protein
MRLYGREDLWENGWIGVASNHSSKCSMLLVDTNSGKGEVVFLEGQRVQAYEKKLHQVLPWGI